MDILIASTNGYKIRETKMFLKPFPFIEIFSLLDFPYYKLPYTSKTSIETNAIYKAQHAAKVLNKWAIADESFLIVPSLGGLPGINTEFFAGLGATDKDNRRKLLELMKGKEGLIERSAYFECCMVLASPEGEVKYTKGLCEGYLAEEEKGSSGFGYDNLFLKYDYNLTFAELSEETKNCISHRSKALKKILVEVEKLARQKSLL